MNLLNFHLADEDAWRSFVFDLHYFTNEIDVYIIFRKGAASRTGLSSEEVERRWEDSNQRCSCPDATIVFALPSERLLSQLVAGTEGYRS